MNKSSVKGFILGVVLSFSVMTILVFAGVYNIERDYSHRIGDNGRAPHFK